MTNPSRSNTIVLNTSLTLAAGLFIYTLLSLVIVFYFILSPMANRAANDMAALMDSISQSWVSLSADERKTFQLHFREHHDLYITDDDVAVTKINKFYPFIPRLEKYLHLHMGQTLIVKQAIEDELCFWVTIPKNGQVVRIGFYHERFGPHPPKAMIGILAAGCLLILVTTFLLVRRITQPIKNLSNATNQLSSGKLSVQIPETGPAELVLLAQNFNRMTKEIAQLLSNRSILFGGISHDLRTPITRMQIALALIEEALMEDTDNSSLISGMRNDLDEMDKLIQQSLELVKGMESHHAVNIKINTLLKEIVAEYSRQDQIIQWQQKNCGICKIEITAFRRVLCNLLDNAFRYGDGHTVSLSCSKVNKKLLICIKDHGPGIPSNKLDIVFQPFYRLDNSRNKKTGGSGLGLAIVKQLCDIHGWKISLLPIIQGGLKAKLEIPVTLLSHYRNN